MIKLDSSLLTELGLGDLPEAAASDFLEHMYETLELRVGEALASQMTEEQFDEFEVFVDTADEEGAFNWLQANFPDYHEVVSREFDKLKIEVGANAEAILASTQ